MGDKHFTLNISSNELIASERVHHDRDKQPVRLPEKNFNQKNKRYLKSSPSKPHSSSADNIVISSLFKSNPSASLLNVKQEEVVSEPLFSSQSFTEANIHDHLVSCLKSRLDINLMTSVQAQAIPVLLKGCDVLVKSCTGSGKTLSYAVPIIHRLQEMTPKIDRKYGICALIIVPTRELVLQCYNIFSTLTKAFTWIVPGYLSGGEKKKSEKARLRKGINILICTPGRLLDHLDSTACLSLDRIHWLVIDEADKLLEEGFETSVRMILSKCNEERQSVLLSATLSQAVKNLAGICLSEDQVVVDVSGKENSEFQNLAIPQNLKQFVTIVPSKLRLAILSGFIIGNCLRKGFKALIFMSSQNSVDFHYSLLNDVLLPLLAKKEVGCKVFKIHGEMKQEDRREVFHAFKDVKEGVLLCTDVAARGLDLLNVDWIIQYTAPLSPEIYVHRIGRTARIGHKGKAILFLLPSENKFHELLANHKINVTETPSERYLQSLSFLSDIFVSKSKVMTAEQCAMALQMKYENEVYSEDLLHKSAMEAYGSYIQSYASYPKNIRVELPFKALHLGHVAKSFCLREPPSVIGQALPHIKRFFAKQPQKQKFKEQQFSISKNIELKRKIPTIVSEFDSGFSNLKEEMSRPAKKQKLKKIDFV